jgi:four helix bundle protein
MRVEELEVYQKLCQLHLDVCDLTRQWPPEDQPELARQARYASNSAPTILAAINPDRNFRNKLDGIGRAKGRIAETVHHLFVAKLRGYLGQSDYDGFQARYEQCSRMLSGMEKRFDQLLSGADPRGPAAPEPDSHPLPAPAGAHEAL